MTLIGKITWLTDSPFNYTGAFADFHGFVAGDVVEIYHDYVSPDGVLPAASKILGYVNGVDGTDNFTYMYTNTPESSPLYNNNKTEIFYNPIFCSLSIYDGPTTRVSFRRISEWPLYEIVKETDHPACTGTSTVCDLNFSGAPVVTLASSETTADGTATINVTTSATPAKFNLGSDFVYAEAGQLSSTITGLLPGTYTVYVRDAANCVRNINVTIGFNQAYGVTDQIDYTDLDGSTTLIEILEKSFVGTAVDYVATSNPIVVSKRGEGEKDKFIPMISTEAVINVMSITNFQYLKFYTNDPDKYRVKYYKDGTLMWTGRILTQQYQEEYNKPPYSVSIVASDGLPQLKDISFVNDETTEIEGDMKQIKVLSFCLKKTGLELPIRCGINIYPTSHTVTATSDPLDICYVNTENYYLKAIPSCDEVIRKILKPYGATLIQWEGYWNIVRVEEMKGTFNYRAFDASGDYTSNGTLNTIINIWSTSQSNRALWQTSPTLDIIGGYGNIKVNYEMGLDANMLKNGDFRLKSERDSFTNFILLKPDTSGFTIVPNGATYGLTYEALDDKSVALVWSSQSGLPYIQSETINVKMGSTDLLKFSFRCKVPKSRWNYAYVKVKVRITYGTYYLQSDGTWTTTATEIVRYTTKYNEYDPFEITAGPPDSGYTSGLDLNVRLYHAYVEDFEYTSYADLRTKVTTTLLTGHKTEALISGSIYYYELENNTSAESVPNIVRPNDYNSISNPYQWIRKSTSVNSGGQVADSLFYVDHIKALYLPEGKDAPEVNTQQKKGETKNNQTYEVTVDHGSLVTNASIIYQLGLGALTFSSADVQFNAIAIGVRNAERIYKGYLKDSSGNPYSTFKRTYVSESKSLQSILIDSIATQYKRSNRRLTGTVVFAGTSPGFLTIFKEKADSDRLYYPIGMSINDKDCSCDGEFIELLDVASSGGSDGSNTSPYTSGFSSGFGGSYN